jgi:macrolide-specific efflux system membrane fusion protein
MKKMPLLMAVSAGLLLISWKAARRGAVPTPGDTFTAHAVEAPIEDAVDVPGWVSPYHRVKIKANVAGRIDRLLAQEGQRVSRGEIIAWMSSTDRASVLDAARVRGPETLARWEKEYKPTPIVSPVDGTVVLKAVVEGQTVDPSVILYNISDTLIVMGEVDEVDIRKVRVGMPAQVTVDAFPGRVATGRVLSIRNDVWNNSHGVLFYPVRVQLDRIPDDFRSQMSASVRIVVRKEEKALVVPAAAVRSRNGVEQV